MTGEDLNGQNALTPRQHLENLMQEAGCSSLEQTERARLAHIIFNIAKDPADAVNLIYGYSDFMYNGDGEQGKLNATPDQLVETVEHLRSAFTYERAGNQGYLPYTPEFESWLERNDMWISALQACEIHAEAAKRLTAAAVIS